MNVTSKSQTSVLPAALQKEVMKMLWVLLNNNVQLKEFFDMVLTVSVASLKSMNIYS